MNKVLSNFHTHTTYCDGENTPREMVEGAISRGFHTLGFSGHAYLPLEGYIGMSLSDTPKYMREIRALQQEFAGRIDIFLGLENDALDPVPTFGYDYSLSSVHYLPQSGRLYCVDETPEKLRECIADGFGGDPYSMAQSYYAEVSRSICMVRPDILGHIDLITKFNEDGAFFNTGDGRYRRAACAAAEIAVRHGVIVEVNTGAMARGYRSAPYPEPFLLRHIYNLGGSIIINSDAHRADMLDYGFEEAARLVYDAGFRKRMELTKNGFHAVPV